MTTRIGIVSDVHASLDALADALYIFQQHRCDRVLCAGDIAGYFTDLGQCIDLLQQNDCLTVSGNHDQEYCAQAGTDPSACEYLHSLPTSREFELAGSRFYMVHAEPPDECHGGIKLLDQQGDLIPTRAAHWTEKLQNFSADILVVGHTHQVYAVQLGDTLVINPGSTIFNHSCMILTLPQRQVETFALQDLEIIPCWNFSMLFRDGGPYPVLQ